MAMRMRGHLTASLSHTGKIMKSFTTLFILLALTGCALEHRFNDPYRERIRACGTVIGICGSEVW